ncbi:hypothetical protein EW146_g7511 [Bondarzewia mesenterica]|uniref:Uncharacterized protein n=1 Tax=Bondarzewia mesenterica TaxID=1095465 RepID=A0A4S4LKK3_9AGAM|nr:hypothetical protein EW146_g7511 [Bondarzewia mesenterica]
MSSFFNSPSDLVMLTLAKREFQIFMLSSPSTRKKPTCHKCSNFMAGHKKADGRVVCPEPRPPAGRRRKPLKPPTPPTTPHRVVSGQSGSESDSPDPLLLVPDEFDEPLWVPSRKRRIEDTIDLADGEQTRLSVSNLQKMEKWRLAELLDLVTPPSPLPPDPCGFSADSDWVKVRKPKVIPGEYIETDCDGSYVVGEEEDEDVTDEGQELCEDEDDSGADNQSWCTARNSLSRASTPDVESRIRGSFVEGPEPPSAKDKGKGKAVPAKESIEPSLTSNLVIFGDLEREATTESDHFVVGSSSTAVTAEQQSLHPTSHAVPAQSRGPSDTAPIAKHGPEPFSPVPTSTSTMETRTSLVTPEMEASEKPWRYLERVFRTRSHTSSSICCLFKTRSEDMRLALEGAREAGLFASIVGGEPGEHWIVICDHEETMIKFLEDRQRTLPGTFVARIGRLRWGVDPTVIEEEMEKVWHEANRMNPALPAQFMAGALGGIVVWWALSSM